MRDYYRKVLDAAGYVDDDPTEENVRSCFLDYVDAGYFRESSGLPLDLDDAGDITLDEMCVNLLRGGDRDAHRDDRAPGVDRRRAAGRSRVAHDPFNPASRR